MVNNPDVKRNAWLQSILNVNWRYIFDGIFSNNDDIHLRDRSRVAVYHLIDWIIDRQSFSREDLLDAADKMQVTISSEKDLQNDIIRRILIVLKKNEYISFKKGRYYKIGKGIGEREPYVPNSRDRVRGFSSKKVEKVPVVINEVPLDPRELSEDEREEIDSLRAQRKEHRNRLRQLELQEARHGNNTEPAITNEILDLKKKIKKISKEIKNIRMANKDLQ